MTLIKQEPMDDRDTPCQPITDKIPGSTESLFTSSAQSLSAVTLHTCQRCNAMFAAQDALIQHQMFCLFPMTSASTLQLHQQSPLLAQQQAQSQQRARYLSRFKQHVHRNLLENIGFECVMQFNEYNQPHPVKKEEKADKDGEDNKKEMETDIKVKSEKDDNGDGE